MFAAGVLVGAIAIAAVKRDDTPAVTTVSTVPQPVQTVYAPSTLADTPSEAERVEFEKFAYRFIEVWLQPGPPAIREAALRPFMTPSGLAAQMARAQDKLPWGVPVGPPEISNTRPRGGMFATKMTTSAPITLLMVRNSPGEWKVDQVEAGIR